MLKCMGCCINVRLQLNDYHLNIHMLSIDVGACDIVLGVELAMHIGANDHGFQGIILEFY